jgi:hypothetical protein
MDNGRASASTLATAVILVMLGLLYTSAGFYRLVTDVPGSFPVDLRLRWTESHLLADGRNTQRVGHPDPLLPDTHKAMRLWGGSYPPWSYTFGLVFAPPVEWKPARLWFALLCLSALALVAWDGWQRGLPFGRTPALIAATLPFTNFASAICLSYGQYGVLVTGLIVAAVRLLESRRRWAAGVVLGFALVKPQLAAAYCVAMAGSRRWRAVAGIALTIVAGTIVMAMAVNEPASAVASRAVVEMAYKHASHNPLLNAATAVIHHRTVVPMLGLSGALLMWWLAMRGAGDAYRLACLSVIVAMFWTYRKHFDVSLMSLPLIWLWLETCRTRRPGLAVLFAALGVTLWLPIRDAQWELWWVAAAQLAVWPAAAVVIARADRRPTASLDPARRPPASA